MLTWSYGVMTTQKRVNDLLPKTITSLAKAGFDDPWIFMDGKLTVDLGPKVTAHQTPVHPYGNWLLSILELYLRNPAADRYALFQDDIVLCLGARDYLNTCKYPSQGYWNLFTFSTNEKRIADKPVGWTLSDQMGRGAVALVFNRDALVALMRTHHILNKPMDLTATSSGLLKGQQNIDGCIITAAKQASHKEYVHQPSLVQHTGEQSTMGNRHHPKAKTFPGEHFNAMELLK